MDKKLYRSLVESIGIAIKRSLNEMARLSIQRTIDRKLWLSVASTCSRNKSTEAEFIKPGKGDKENLLNRYVAALIIMRKPCPQNEDDIDNLKTFKLVGHKYLELGGSIEEIQDLYNKNTGKSSTSNKTERKTPVTKQDDTEEPKTISKGFDNAVEQKSNFSCGLFDDDDIFGEDEEDKSLNSELTKQIISLPKNTSLQQVLMQNVGINKPRGWKYIKHTNEEYDKFILNANINPEYIWSYPKYLKDFINIINSKKWKLYKVEATMFAFRFENMNPQQVKQQIEYGCQNRYTLSKNVTEVVNKRFNEYNEYINKRRETVSKMDNSFVKNMFEQDENVYQVYLSPDEGLMLTCTKPKPVNVSFGNTSLSKNFYTNYNEWTWTLTFTGNVNDYDDNGIDKKKLEDNNKLYNKRKRIFRKLLTDNCGLKSFKWTMFKDDDNYPIMVKICSKGACKITYDNFTKKYYNPYSTKSQYLYIPSDEKTFPNSFKEAIQNREKWGMSWIKLVCCTNDGKYGHSLYGGSDDETYMIIMPTESGKAKIDSML